MLIKFYLSKADDFTVTEDALADSDFFLAEVILPVLKYIKENKDSAPEVDDEDVPPSLRRTELDILALQETPTYIDDNYFERWDYVVDKMISTFTIIISYKYYSDAPSPEVKEGLRLFGKYYPSLWC